MATLRGKRWQGSAYDARKKRFRYMFDTKQEALDWEEAARAAVADGRAIPPPTLEGRSLGEHVARCERLVWGQARAPKTVRSHLRRITSGIGEHVPVTAIGPLIINDFKLGLLAEGLSVGTINNTLNYLNRILQFAQEEGLKFPSGRLPKAPLIPGRKRCRIREITDSELAELKRIFEDHGREDISLFATILRYTGARRGETLALRWEHVTSRIIFEAHTTKTGKARSIPILAPVAEAFAALRNLKVKDPITGLRDRTRPFETITVSHLAYHWQIARREMGLLEDRDFVWHAFRHTNISHQVRCGVPLTIVKDWHGHSNISTTMNYAHLAPTDFDQVSHLLGIEEKKGVSEIGSEPLVSVS